MSQALTKRQKSRLRRAYNALALLHDAIYRAEKKINEILAMESLDGCEQSFVCEHTDLDNNDGVRSYEEALAEIKTGASGASCCVDGTFEQIDGFIEALRR